MQPAFTDSTAPKDEQKGNWDALALALNFFGLSLLFIVVSFINGILGTGSALWRWLSDQNNAKET